MFSLHVGITVQLSICMLYVCYLLDLLLLEDSRSWLGGRSFGSFFVIVRGFHLLLDGRKRPLNRCLSVVINLCPLLACLLQLAAVTTSPEEV